MYIFLIKLTGVHWVELQAVKKRGDAYRQYQKKFLCFSKNKVVEVMIKKKLQN